MYQADCWIRSYSGATDTCTVELVGVGVIDTWIDGIKIDAALNRAYVVPGKRATITMPDAHRICEALVTAIQPGTTAPSTVDVPPPAGTTPASQTTEFGAGVAQASAGGVITQAITFPVPFSSTAGLVITASLANDTSCTITGVTATGFTLNATGQTPFAFVPYSYQATGPA